MTRLIVFVFALFLALPSMSQEEPQNYHVTFYGENTNGVPQFWPKRIVGVGTNTSAPSGMFLFTEVQLADLKATNATAFAVGNSNRTYAAKVLRDANIARLLTLYNAIPDARTTLRSFSNATNTLSTAQLTTAVRQMAGYQEAIMEFLQRLGPVLKEIYRPEQDTTP